MIDDHKDDGWRNPVSVDHSGYNRIDKNQPEVGEVKEMVIGVGNGRFVWALYGESEFPEPSETPISLFRTSPRRSPRRGTFSRVVP